MVLATSALLALSLSACAANGSVADGAAPPAPPRATSTSPASGTSGDANRTERPDTTRSEVANPVRIRIPEIGVSARVIPLRLDSDGRLVAPKRYHVAGWNKAGPEPGERGTAVIAGHVDSRTGPAVFFRLRELQRGDRVHVDRADGSTATFVITRLVRHPKSRVSDEVYRPARRPELRLITCGGAFDDSRGSYRDNIIGYARG